MSRSSVTTWVLFGCSTLPGWMALVAFFVSLVSGCVTAAPKPVAPPDVRFLNAAGPKPDQVYACALWTDRDEVTAFTCVPIEDFQKHEGGR